MELLAALLFASKDEARYAITGVNIDLKPGRKPIIVTTDGRRLVAIESAADQPEDADTIASSVVFKAVYAKALCMLSKAVGLKICPWIEFEWHPGHSSIKAAIAGAECCMDTAKGALIEGNYPNWTQVIPPKNAKREPINDLGLDSGLMADFAKAIKIMDAKTPAVQMTTAGKEHAVEINLLGLRSFYCLIMPMKSDEAAESQPEFITIATMFPKVVKTPEVEPEPVTDEV